MDDTELQQIAEDILAELEAGLHEWLEEENLLDNNMTRATFYQAGVNQFVSHPDEDPEFQLFMMTLVTEQRNHYLGLAAGDVYDQFLTIKE